MHKSRVGRFSNSAFDHDGALTVVFPQAHRYAHSPGRFVDQNRAITFGKGSLRNRRSPADSLMEPRISASTMLNKTPQGTLPSGLIEGRHLL